MTARSYRFLDAFFVITLAAFAATSLLCDRTGALDIIGPDSSDPFARAVYWYGVRYDPLIVENPLFLQVMSGISAFVFGPIHAILSWGFARRSNRIRTLGIVWAWTMLYSMLVHIAVEIWGPLPPPQPLVFVGTYAVYAIAPILLLWRFRMPEPFGPAGD